MKLPPKLLPGRLELLLGALVFGATFTAASTGAVSAPEFTLRWRAQGDDGYVPERRAPPGRELAMVFIGSSTCAASNHNALPAAVERLKTLLRDRAVRSNRTFAAHGVARDWDVDAGLAHLHRFGQFDEVTAGRNWLNSGVVHYVWEDIPGEAATPQVIVVDRQLVDRRSPQAADGVVRDERLVTRLVGWPEIVQWLERGAPMPALPAVARPDSMPAAALVSATPVP